MSKPKIEYDPTTRTLQPCVTGSMIVGLTYKNGAFLAADTMGSYGGLRMFKDMNRVIKVNENCIIAASGDLADLQELERIISEQVREDEVCLENQQCYDAKSLHSWLQCIMYNRRSNQDPFWLTVAVAGKDTNTKKPFLGVVDQLGVSYQAPHISTGFGGYIAGPFLELKTPNQDFANLEKDEAEKLLKKALSVVTYRDKMTLNSWNIAHVGRDEKAEIISVQESLPTEWGLAHMIVGYE